METFFPATAKLRLMDVVENAKMNYSMQNVTVLFDGYCVLCSGFARWLHRKMKGSVKLLAMQSEQGQLLLNSYGVDENRADEVVVIRNREVLTGAPAILMLLNYSGYPGRIFYHIFKIAPSSLVKWGYRVIAGNRYKWFGKRDTCTIIQD